MHGISVCIVSIVNSIVLLPPRERSCCIDLKLCFYRRDCSGHPGRLLSEVVSNPGFSFAIDEFTKPPGQCFCPSNNGVVYDDKCRLDCNSGSSPQWPSEGVCRACDCSDLTMGGAEAQCDTTGQCPCPDGMNRDKAGRRCVSVLYLFYSWEFISLPSLIGNLGIILTEPWPIEIWAHPCVYVVSQV